MSIASKCVSCGAVTTHMIQSAYGWLCPLCQAKIDRQTEKLTESLKPTQPIRLMQPGCTCCPIHGNPFKTQQT